MYEQVEERAPRGGADEVCQREAKGSQGVSHGRVTAKAPGQVNTAFLLAAGEKSQTRQVLGGTSQNPAS